MGAQKLAAARAALARAESAVGLAGSQPQVQPQSGGNSWDLPPELSPLFPRGLAPGMTLGVSGSRIALALVASLVSAQGAWCIYLGVPDMGWEACAGLGSDLNRIVTIPYLPPARSGAALSAAIDLFDVVIVGSALRLDTREQRRLAQRARNRETLLIAENWQVRDRVNARYESVTGPASGSGHIAHITVELRSAHGVRLRIAWDATGWHPAAGLRAVPSAREATPALNEAAPALNEVAPGMHGVASRRAAPARRIPGDQAPGTGLRLVPVTDARGRCGE
ncbi:hypothetical protein [Actinotignum sp. GS-2025d]